VLVQREPLSKERVLRAAMKLVDSEGIDALSMRRLAAQLGVEAMSLYYHVKNKDDILTGIGDLAMSEIELPVGGADWKAAVRASAISYHDTLRRHGWVTSLPVSGEASMAQLHYMDALLKRLREAGLSPELTHHAYHALESHVVGSALWLGILTSMFSAVFFSRGLVNLWYGSRKKIQTLAIGQIWKPQA